MADETTTPRNDASTYTYSPLPTASSIRLLRRIDRHEPGPLRFSLQTYDISNPALSYHCLSYTWGNPFAHGRVFEDFYREMAPAYAAHDAATILVDGLPLRVSRNLHDALSTVPESALRDYTNRPTAGRGGQTPMHAAASAGSAERLRRYARRGGDPDAVDGRGRTPLHCAAASGSEECVELLCKMRVLRSPVDNERQSPKQLAAAAGHHSVVRRLEDWEAWPGPVASAVLVDEDGAEKRLWVDAICINQRDVGEKSSQVSMMDQIYTRASFVIAWLGPADRHTEAGLRAYNTLVSFAERFHQSQIEPFNGTDEGSYATARVPLIPPGEWEGLASIYQRQWFRRAWIVQEAVLPGIVIAYCGPHMLEVRKLGFMAQQLREASARCGTRGGEAYAPLDSIAVSVEWNMAEIFKWRGYRNHPHETGEERRDSRAMFKMGPLVRDFRAFLSSEPRDKIFSLLGLLHKFSDEKQRADYRIPLAKVFAAATRRIIEGDGDLRVLCERNDVGAAYELSSWVPDFSVPGVIAIPLSAADGGVAFAGLKDDEPDNPVLAVRGLRVGSISEVAGRVSTAPGGALMFEPAWLRLALSLRNKQDPDAEKPVLTEVLWRTLCMNAPSGAFFDSAEFRNEAPEEMGRQFLIFMVSMILAGADQKMLESVGLEADQEREMHTEIHSPACEPWKGELAETLGRLDELAEHDTRHCFTPTREEIMWSWDDLKYTLMRTSDVRDTGAGYDFSVSSRVADGTDRLVGRGVVNLDSPVYRKCRDFGAAFQAAYGGRQLATVDGKYLGLVPVGARSGDEVWVVPGLKAPAVLRWIEGPRHDVADGEGWFPDERVPVYEFVGISYVHGIMNGEAIRGKEDKLRGIDLE